MRELGLLVRTDAQLLSRNTEALEPVEPGFDPVLMPVIVRAGLALDLEVLGP